MGPNDYQLVAENVSVRFYTKKVLHNISLQIDENSITALVGPTGCGKSTFLRLFNRMNERYDGYKMSGEVYVDGENIYKSTTDVELIRSKVGMVFRNPVIFPGDIQDNLLFGLKLKGKLDQDLQDKLIENALNAIGIWDTIKDKLDQSPHDLSFDMQQKLCLARVLTLEPSVILMDEFTSKLDHSATTQMEELILSLKKRYTIITATHNISLAGRLSDRMAFFYEGRLVEYNDTKAVFMNPESELTENYITGRFG